MLQTNPSCEQSKCAYVSGFAKDELRQEKQDFLPPQNDAPQARNHA